MDEFQAFPDTGNAAEPEKWKTLRLKQIG